VNGAAIKPTKGRCLMIVLFLKILNDYLTSPYFSGDYNTENYFRDHPTKLTPLDPLQIEDSGSFFCAATI